MSFAQPLMLFLLILPLTWMLLLWSGKVRRGSWWRIASLTAIVVSASKPQFLLHNSRVAPTLFAATSASISDSDLKKESAFIHNIEQVQGKNEFRMIPFGHIPGDNEGVERIATGCPTLAAGSIARCTDVGGAVPLSGRLSRDLRLDTAALPTTIFPRERFPIDLDVTSPHRVLAEIVTSSGREPGKPRPVRPRAIFISSNGPGFTPGLVKTPAIPEEQQFAIQELFRHGCVVPIGGEQKGSANCVNPIDLTLPAMIGNSSAVPDSCFVLVIEKSQSMSATQMELAQLSALEIIENLSRKDLVGVLAFDDVPHWLVPIGTMNERASIDDSIQSINPGGGTRIAPALGEALRQILSTAALSKHIVFITDGRSRDIDTEPVAAEARARHVTITTVGLVDALNHGYLAKLARTTAGHSYLIREPWDVEGALFRDVATYSTSNFSNTALGQSENEPRRGVRSRSPP